MWFLLTILPPNNWVFPLSPFFFFFSEKSAKLLSILKSKAGRILFEGVPTGVAVTQAMQHGGPYPASTDSRFTSVGTDAIYRWLRPIVFQDCPNDLLPEILKNENPLGLKRKVDGEITSRAL